MPKTAEQNFEELQALWKEVHHRAAFLRMRHAEIWPLITSKDKSAAQKAFEDKWYNYLDASSKTDQSFRRRFKTVEAKLREAWSDMKKLSSTKRGKAKKGRYDIEPDIIQVNGILSDIEAKLNRAAQDLRDLDTLTTS